ncbi:DUF4127 family protein [Paenibacillus sp. GCM10012307]|uniref:DUF4127 family protein n=1 Tax=Paenibacillus roseus TaxID=2798579 RepID=A0A934J4B7_9BACL|nr:DUF4127 family protein [Paenibacillus roseus]MBJ6360170.1 DUF4127 family protein [Paenibacillus roseus]
MKKVVYVPLDDRPVNLDDVIVQGKSAGIEVITPNAGDIRNRLDTQKTVSGSEVTSTSDPVYGKPGDIARFIEERADEADGFIISIDMLAYGGLIGSRYLRPEDSQAYPDFDCSTTDLLDTIRRVKQMCPHKPVYVMDTIMRLATTVHVEGLTTPAYQESRNFMRQPRKHFESFEEILEGYDLKPDGTAYGDTVHFNKTHFYNTRRHKLKTTRYVLERLTQEGYIDFLAIGVDDAYIEGVQANEIAWVEERIDSGLGGVNGKNPDRAVILPDADGLGHSLLARMAGRIYHGPAKPRYRVRYYGPHGSTVINPYEYMDVNENIRSHVDIAGGQLVASGPFEMDIIAVTDDNQAAQAVEHVEANGGCGVPSIVLDFTSGGVANEKVTTALLASPFTGRLLGYSAWNTAGNKIGLAVGMGHARYAFLTGNVPLQTLNAALNAHGTLLFKRFLKDYAYKALTIGEIRAEAAQRSPYTNVTADANMLLFVSASDYSDLSALLEERMQTHTAILAAANAFIPAASPAACNIHRIHSGAWDLVPYTSVTLPPANTGFTWGRAFEITLNPSAELGLNSESL